MASHDFNLPGGDILSDIGASWFVSYAYYQKVDKQHLNWMRVSSYPSRASKYRTSTEYHQIWLTEILNMRASRLNTNKIGLQAEQILSMVQAVLHSSD